MVEKNETQNPTPTPARRARRCRKPAIRSDRRLTLQPQLFEIASLGQSDDARFEREFLEEVYRRDPCNEEVLMALGHTYTRLGEYEKGLEIDRRLVRLRPSDPTAFYNLACSHSLLSHLDDAIAALERAVSLGYQDVPHLMKDPDLINLRQDPRFRRLMGRILGQSPSNS